MLWISLLSCSYLISGEKNIILKSGKNHLVKTYINGKPIHHRDSLLEIKSILPTFNKAEGWRHGYLIWSIYFYFKTNFNGTIIVSSLLNDKTSNRIQFKSVNELGRRTALTWNVLDREHAPEVWEWINEPGESWVPFCFQVQHAGSNESTTFIDWALITEENKMAAKKDLINLTLYNEKIETKTIKLQDNKLYTIKFLNNELNRFSNTFLQIDHLTPGLIRNHLGVGTGMPVWVIKGRYRGSAGSFITLSTPWINNEIINKVKLSGQGEFSIQFGQKSNSPYLWDWLDGNGENWIPIKVKLETDDSIYNSEFVEWFYVNDDVRKLFIDMIKIKTQ
ncbi:MAG: hypothetical protein KA743_02775 [Geothrix sp.]|jgi:hypothetical protein|nr:hypothetical protein [Geothrix sp.]